MAKIGSSEVEDKRRKISLQKKFSQRITTARHGRDAFQAGDYVQAARKYSEYLLILSEMNDLSDIYELRPSMFNAKSQLTEILLISHVFWELARMYEMTPKLQPAFAKCMDQFVRFTINQPFQVLNAEMLRKYIKKNEKKSTQITKLNEAYARIYVQSSKCYISTLCFGSNHEVTIQLRKVKNSLVKSHIGIRFVSSYYRFSFPFVEYLEDHNIVKYPVVNLSKPILRIIAYIHKTMFN